MHPAQRKERKLPWLLRFGFVVSAEGILQLVISKTSGWATQSGKIMFAQRFQDSSLHIIGFWTTCFTHQCLHTVLATRKLCEEIADECSRTLRQVYLWKRVRKFGSTWLFDSLESNFSHLPSLGSPKHVAGIWWTQVDFSWPRSKSGQIWRRPPKWPEQREQTKK